MAKIVAILEDNLDRVAGMRTWLGESLPGVEAVFFENARDMIDWLGEHLADVVLISLDHDLPVRNDEGESVDCGTGREVADYLASLPAICPVIVHSSNDVGAQGMFFALKDGGWACKRAYPCGDIAWIGAGWGKLVREYLRE